MENTNTKEWEEGYKALENGYGIETNPYTDRTQEHLNWQSGYRAAQLDYEDDGNKSLKMSAGYFISGIDDDWDEEDWENEDDLSGIYEGDEDD